MKINLKPFRMIILSIVILCILISSILVVSAINQNTNTTDEQQYKYGDVNLDGEVTISDATLTQKYLAGLELLSDEQLILADVNGDGEVTINDVTEIQKYLAGLIEEFSVGEWYIIGEDDTETPKGIIFKDGTIELSSHITYQQNGSIFTFPITEETKRLKEGVVFILPTTEPFKVTSISEVNGSYIVETEDPEIQETLKSINVEGTQNVDMNDFIPAEGVTIKQQSQVTSQNFTQENIKSRNLDLVSTAAAIDFGTLSLSATHKINNNIEISADISIKNLKLEHKVDMNVDWHGVNLNDVYLKALFDIEITGGVTVKNESGTNPKNGFFTIGKIPVLGVPGIGMYVEISIGYELSGELEVVFTCNGEAGFQIYQNQPRHIATLNPNYDVTKLELSGQIGPKIEGLLEIVKTWDLIDFSIYFGGKAKGTLTLSKEGWQCIDANLFLFAEFNALDKGIIGDWLDLKYKYDIFDENNSPLKKHFHFENLKLVSKCTVSSRAIKFTNNLNWDKVYAYFWDKDNSTVGEEFPGTQMNWYQNNSNGKGDYTINVPQGADYVIFSNGADQTFSVPVSNEAEGYWLCGNMKMSNLDIFHYPLDIPLLVSHSWNESCSCSIQSTQPTKPQDTTPHTVYFKDTGNWHSVYAYYWSNDSTVENQIPLQWPGQNMSKVEGNVYKVIVPNEYEQIIFSNGSEYTKTLNLTIQGDSYLYDFSTKLWSKY